MSPRPARPSAVGRQVKLQGWIRTRRDSKGGFSFLEMNDGSCQGNVQISPRPRCRTTRAKSRNSAPAQRHGRRAGQSLARQGPGHRGAGRRVIVHGYADPETYPLAEEAAFVRVSADDRPSAAADQHLRRHRPVAQLRGAIDPRFLPGTRLPLHPHADHHGQRLRRRRRDVQGHHARPGQRARSAMARSTTRRISSTSRPI